MYPLAEGLFAPKNQWYIAAWSEEVSREPLERWILDEPVAFYRTEDGAAVALDGRCPHRSFPLGKSRVVGDNVECGYHGITFRPDGSCASIPSQGNAPAICRVKSYAVAERWQWIWIWPGDPALADESLIPDHDALGLTQPQHDCTTGFYRSVPGRYTLLHDNLLDLTHLGFLHQATFGNGTGAANIVPKHISGPGWVESKFSFEGIECPSFAQHLFQYDGLVNRRFGLRFFAPCLHAGAETMHRVNEDGSEGELLGSILIYHAVTPATKTTSHYFVTFGHSWETSVHGLSAKILAEAAPGLEEDIFATREVEMMVSHQGDRPSELLFRADAICALGRRILENMIRSEQDCDQEAPQGSQETVATA